MKYLVAREGVIDRSGEMFEMGSLSLNNGKTIPITINFDWSKPPIAKGTLLYDDGCLYLEADIDDIANGILVPCISFLPHADWNEVLEVSLMHANPDPAIQSIGIQNKQIDGLEQILNNRQNR